MKRWLELLVPTYSHSPALWYGCPLGECLYVCRAFPAGRWLMRWHGWRHHNGAKIR